MGMVGFSIDIWGKSHLGTFGSYFVGVFAILCRAGVKRLEGAKPTIKQPTNGNNQVTNIFFQLLYIIHRIISNRTVKKGVKGCK